VPTDLSAPADGDVVVRPDTTARAHTRRGWLLLAIAAFQAWLWITRTWNLLTADEGRDTAFIVVHLVLYAAALAVAGVLAVLGWRMRAEGRRATGS
jgi:hypothetical protein